MLQGVIIHQELDYTLIPWTSIVCCEYSPKPFNENEKNLSAEYFRIFMLGADIQLLECLVFGGESANILNKSFRQLGDAPPVVDVYASDLIDRYLIR